MLKTASIMPRFASITAYNLALDNGFTTADSFEATGTDGKVTVADVRTLIEGAKSPKGPKGTKVPKAPKEQKKALGGSASSSKKPRFDSPGAITKAARELAEKEGLSMEDLAQVKGSGKGGRILVSDIESMLSSCEESSDCETEI